MYVRSRALTCLFSGTCFLIRPPHSLHLVSKVDQRVFSRNTTFFAVKVVNIPQGDVGGVKLHKPNVVAAHDSDGEVES